jgi:osmotically-inducible protein OsmY
MFIALAFVGLGVAAPLLARGDDKEIARQIIAKLKVERAAGRLDGFDVDLKVEKGVVWLRGQAASTEQEKLVLETARLTPGVVSVMKNIRVGETPSASPRPAELISSRRSEPAMEIAQSPPQAAALPAPRIAREETPRPSSRRNPQEESLLQLLTGPAIPQPVNLAPAAPPQSAPMQPSQPIQPIVATPAPAIQFKVEPATPGPVQAMHTVAVNNAVSPVQPASANQPTIQVAAPPASPKSQDQEISQMLGGRLKQAMASGRLDGRNLAFKVENGVVWLRGSVISSDHEQLVVTTAQTTPGVSKVLKDIQITTVQDAYIAARPIAAEPRESETVQAAATQPVANTPVKRSAPAAGAAANTAANGLQRTGPVQPQLMPVNPYAYPYAGYYPMSQAPVAFAPAQPASAEVADAAGAAASAGAAGMPPYGAGLPVAPVAFGGTGVRYDHPHLPAYSWPSYAAYPNYGAVTYPKTYSPTVWPYIGPFYPYPQVPLGWRKVTLEWDDGWWQLDFKDQSRPWKRR